MSFTVPVPDNAKVAKLQCGKCDHVFELKVADPDPMPEGTIIGDGEERDPKGTVIAPVKSHYEPRLECEGKVYALHDGRQTVGRYGEHVVADVRLNVDDRTMSRHHVVIEVKRSATGVSVTLTIDEAKHDTVVNGVKLMKGDVVALNDGCRMRFGATELIYRD